MSETVATRPYVNGDEDQIVGLLQRVFGTWPKFDLKHSSLDHWRWKYLDNPPRKKVVVVAESGGKIVGSHHGVYSRVKVGDRSVLTQQGTDLAVDKDFRGMGLYGKMQAVKDQLALEAGASLGYGLSTNPIVVGVLHERNLPFPSPLQYMVNIRDIELHLKNSDNPDDVKKKYGYLGMSGLNLMRNKLRAKRRSGSEFQIFEKGMFGEEIDAFWGLVKDYYNFIIERDRGYLNWRYSDKRGGDYKILQVNEGERLIGYIVLRVNALNRDYPKGYIVDLLTIPGRLDVANALIRNAAEFFIDEGVNIVQALAISGHPYKRLLEESGFVNGMVNYYLGYRVIKPEEDIKKFESSSPERLHFMFGDLDWI
jgi:predicted N-acetyltransferase YhbS